MPEVDRSFFRPEPAVQQDERRTRDCDGEQQQEDHDRQGADTTALMDHCPVSRRANVRVAAPTTVLLQPRGACMQDGRLTDPWSDTDVAC